MTDVFEWVFSGNTHYGNPSQAIPIENDPNFGLPFWQAVNMSQEDADAVIADYHMFHLRAQRDIRLKETDWVSGEDVPQSIKDVYFPYRQSLREITDTYTSLSDVVWPTKP